MIKFKFKLSLTISNSLVKRSCSDINDFQTFLEFGQK